MWFFRLDFALYFIRGHFARFREISRDFARFREISDLADNCCDICSTVWGFDWIDQALLPLLASCVPERSGGRVTRGRSVARGRSFTVGVAVAGAPV